MIVLKRILWILLEMEMTCKMSKYVAINNLDIVKTWYYFYDALLTVLNFYATVDNHRPFFTFLCEESRVFAPVLSTTQG